MLHTRHNILTRQTDDSRLMLKEKLDTSTNKISFSKFSSLHHKLGIAVLSSIQMRGKKWERMSIALYHQNIKTSHSVYSLCGYRFPELPKQLQGKKHMTVWLGSVGVTRSFTPKLYGKPRAFDSSRHSQPISPISTLNFHHHLNMLCVDQVLNAL